MNFTVILLDLNKFKPINDEHGHHEGDFALKTFAQTMQREFREVDVIGRLGGDEFVVFLTDTEDEQVQLVLERFAEAVAATNKKMNKPYNIEFSAGVAHFNHDSELSLEQMLEKADAAMYLDKKGQER